MSRLLSGNLTPPHTSPTRLPILIRPCNWNGAPFAHLQVLPKNATPVVEWSNRDAAWDNVVNDLILAIKDARKNSPTTVPPAIREIPYRRNYFFTGRQEILTKLYRNLHEGRVTTLSGLGGIGKTQIAVEYTYRFQHEYQAMFWVRAESIEYLTTDFIKIATQLNLPEKDEPNQTITIDAIKQWLQTNHQWLLILDNANDLGMVYEFFPLIPSNCGHVLLTTHARATGRETICIKVDTMPPSDGTLFLLRRAKIIRHDDPLEEAVPSDILSARAICEVLGGLPLALDQAGAYIEENECILPYYLEQYRKGCKELLNKRDELTKDHRDSVTTTLLLSFQRVEQKMPAAADLLRLCASLSPDAIPEKIITQGAAHLGLVLAPVADNHSHFQEAIKTLLAYSLISRNTNSQDPTTTLSIHRLVQAVLLAEMDSPTRKCWAERAVRAVSEAFPTVEFATWGLCESLLPHANISRKLIKEYNMNFLESATLLNQAGIYLKERGKYEGDEGAEPFLKSALEIHRTSGQEQDIALDLSHLADLYYKMGEHFQAEKGEASQARARGYYIQAGEKCKEALAIDERTFGPQHERVAMDLSDLAQCFCRQYNDIEAKHLLHRSLDIYNHYEQIHNRKHPNIATLLNNLAGLHSRQGDYEQAEILYKEALEINNTGDALVNLAILYGKTERYAEAEQLLLKSELHDSERESPGIATIAYILAGIYSTQGKHTEAERLYWRALRIRTQLFGPKHPEVKIVVDSIRHYYHAKGKDMKAVEQKLKDPGNMNEKVPEFRTTTTHQIPLIRFMPDTKFFIEKPFYFINPKK